ncbi:MAG: hypothetical protein CM15mP49_01480 [Actinomycetota bacterium]|nr:MAG: hypothetical protein CM15mP49_01480 [Actinomycetota bacterium]
MAIELSEDLVGIVMAYRPRWKAKKQLQVSGRAAITEFGIEKFNAYCQESVLKYTDEWEKVVTRQARWVDFENDYKTMDLDYMESVMWAFKQLWDQGLSTSPKSNSILMGS